MLDKQKIAIVFGLIYFGGVICVYVFRDMRVRIVPNNEGFKGPYMVKVKQEINLEDWKTYQQRHLHSEAKLSNQIKPRFEELPTERAIHRKILNCTKRGGILTIKRLPVTGLASFPGSGNTWTRHLIQQMTGIATSSVYCDKSLLENGFPFECYKDKSRTIVVKAHKTNRYSGFERLVLLIRNPFDAVLSKVHFNLAGHTSRPGIDLLKQKTKKIFNKLVQWYVNLIADTIKTFPGPVYVLQYDQLKLTLTDELQKLAQFLNVNVTQHDIDCTVMLQEGNFHRKKNLTEQFNILKAVYSPKQLLILRDVARYSEMLIHRAYGLSIDIGGRTEQMLFVSTPATRRVYVGAPDH